MAVIAKFFLKLQFSLHISISCDHVLQISFFLSFALSHSLVTSVLMEFQCAYRIPHTTKNTLQTRGSIKLNLEIG